MISVSVLPFHIGRIAAEPIGAKTSAFYNAVARQLLGPACELRTEYLTETIPLYYEMSLNADIVHLAVKRRTEHWSGIDFIIIDLTTPSPFALPSHHVIGGVLAFIKSQRANALRRYLILLPMMLAGADPAMKAMFPLLDEGMLGVLSDNGDHIGLPETWSYFSKDDYIVALRDARPPLASVLRKKFIRFPGHFSRYTGDHHTHCVQYFFDGSLCQRELVALLADQAIGVMRKYPNVQIFYHSTVSRWLENAVRAFGQRINSAIINLEDIMKGKTFRFEKPIWLIVPLSDTRETIKSSHKICARTRLPRPYQRLFSFDD